jgi:hypothetical protein
LLTVHVDSLQKIGGGFCDCGDPHSWKASAFCPNHKPVVGSVSTLLCLKIKWSFYNAQILEQANNFPPYLVTATHAVFRAVLFRLQDLLTSGTLYLNQKKKKSVSP